MSRLGALVRNSFASTLLDDAYYTFENIRVTLFQLICLFCLGKEKDKSLNEQGLKRGTKYEKQLLNVQRFFVRINYRQSNVCGERQVSQKQQIRLGLLFFQGLEGEFVKRSKYDLGFA